MVTVETTSATSTTTLEKNSMDMSSTNEHIDATLTARIAEILMEKYGYNRDEWPLEWDTTDPYSQLSAWTESTRDVITAIRSLGSNAVEEWVETLQGN